jgi:hypothetical protein
MIDQMELGPDLAMEALNNLGNKTLAQRPPIRCVSLTPQEPKRSLKD